MPELSTAFCMHALEHRLLLDSLCPCAACEVGVGFLFSSKVQHLGCIYMETQILQ